MSKEEVLSFMEWVGDNYVKLHGVWVKKYHNESDRNFYTTSEEAYKNYFRVKRAMKKLMNIKHEV